MMAGTGFTKASCYSLRMRLLSPLTWILGLALVATGCSDKPSEPRLKPPVPLAPGAEAMSLLGQPLSNAPIPSDKRAEREKLVEEAKAMPADAPDRALILGRRLAYAGRYQDAIAAFTEGLAKNPDDVRLLRHRGHRYINTRRFDAAIADLERAARLIQGKPDEVEPEVQPNPKAGPVNSLHASIWYHLGIARYLTRNFQGAERAWREGLKIADNPDKKSSTSYWLYLALRRLGQYEEAKKLLDTIDPKWTLVESGSYHKLLLVFRGDRKADDVLAEVRKDPEPVPFPTVAYGLCAWYSLEGDDRKADALRREIVKGPMWPAFGFIAAEAELAGM
jgi:tetratricopeptide (TPR) repeat protein